MAIRIRRVVGVYLVLAVLLFFCSTAGAQLAPQPAAPVSPPNPSRLEPSDVLGRDTPRGTVLGFLIAAREGDNATAAQYLNTRETGKAAAVLVQQLFVVLDRRLPAGLTKLSDDPEGNSMFPAKADRNVIGTITSAAGNVDITVERVSRGKDTLLWLFSPSTLSAVPRLFEESDTIAIEDVLPTFLVQTRIARMPLFQWLAVFVGLPLLYVFFALCNLLLSHLVDRVRRRESNRGDGPNPNALPIPLRLLFIALTIRWVLANVTLPLLGREFWTATAGVITIVSCVWMLILLNGVFARFVHRRLPRLPISILQFGQRAVDGLFIFAGILIIFRYFGVNVTAAIAGLGVGGIAIALAAQKTLENVIGGISVVFDRAVRIGELVSVGDNRGFVEHVGLRSTRIRTLERTVVSIPNGQLATASLENFSIRDKCWFHHTLRLRHETAVASMRGILNAVESLLTECPHVESGSARVRFLGLGTSSLDVEIFAYVLATDWAVFLQVQQDLLLDIMEVVEAAGTKLAYPSQSLYLAKSDTSDERGEQQTREAASGSGTGR